MAGVLEIPAVVGLGKFLTDVSGGDVVIVDGNRGVLILDPDEETLRALRADPQPVSARFESQLDELRDLPAETTRRRPRHAAGQHRVPAGEHATAWSAAPTASACIAPSSSTWASKTDPTEAEHLEAYLTVLRTLGPNRPVVIRTLDLGADKFAAARRNRRRRSAIRSWACAAFGCVCGI